jgi:Leucine-rich repeat (LRR) protein
MPCLTPADFPKAVEISLSSCQLTKLHLDYFGDDAKETLRDLQHLSLSQNQLETIASRSFTKITSLKHLDLSYNRIESLANGAFEGLWLLEQLLLHHNWFSTIDLVVFIPFVELSRLDISDNFIVSLTAKREMTVNVKVLDITNNRLGDIAAIKYVPQLVALGLSRNGALKLDATTFSKNSKIGWLALRSVGLKMSANFNFLAEMNSLDALYLDDNNLTGLTLESLPSLRNLITLSLVNCSLNALDLAMTPRKFSRLKTLSLEKNQFNSTQLQSSRSFFMWNYIRSSGNQRLGTKSYYYTDIPDEKLMDCSKNVRKVVWKPEYVKYVEEKNLTIWLGFAAIFLFFTLLTIVLSWVCKKSGSSSARSDTKIEEVIKPSDNYDNDTKIEEVTKPSDDDDEEIYA